MTTTSNFGLPIYGANDIPKWDDTNTPFQNLDSKVPDKTANNSFSGTNTFNDTVTHNASLSMQTGSVISSHDGVITTTPPSSDKTGTGVIDIYDSQNHRLFGIRPIQHSDGKIDLDIASYSATNSGTLTFNGVDVMNQGYGDNYSSTEQVIGTWVDGKTIYRKVLTGTTNANGGHTKVDIDTTVDSLVRLDGYIYGNNPEWVSINKIGTDVTGISIAYDKQHIEIWVTPSFNYAHNRPLVIIVEYTKA